MLRLDRAWLVVPLVLLPARAAAQCDVQHLSDPGPARHQGFGLGLEASGDRVVVTAPYDDRLVRNAGSALVYERSGSGWILDAEIDAPFLARDTHFGLGAALAGDELVLGAPYEGPFPWRRTGTGGLPGHTLGDLLGSDHGAAYVFERGASGWERTQRLRPTDLEEDFWFGMAVELEQDTLVVSAPGHRQGATELGAVYVFERVLGRWVQAELLFASDGAHRDYFGQYLELQGDRLLIGAAGAWPEEKVYVFDRGPNGWQESGILSHNRGGGQWTFFGSSMALVGDRAVIGAWYSHLGGPGHSGVVFIYERLGGQWSLVQTLSAPVPQSEGHFGYQVAAEGDWLFVSAPGETLGTAHRWGRVHRYRHDGASYVHAGSWRPDPRQVELNFGRSLAVSAGRAWIGSGSSSPNDVFETPVTTIPYEPLATPYCSCPVAPTCGNADAFAGCANSTGAGARLEFCGSTSIALDDATLTASGLPIAELGFLSMGGAAASTPFGDGLRCVAAGGAGLFDFPPRTSDAVGRITEGPGLAASSASLFGPAGTILPGSSWYFQLTYRDPSGPCGTGLGTTNALEMQFVP